MITNKSEIRAELDKNIGKLCLFDIYKENSFAYSLVGKLEQKDEYYFEIKDFCIYPNAINNVEYFGVMLRIQIRP